MGDNINPDSSKRARSNVIKFGKAKKSLARQAKEKNADQNRTRFGQKKSDKDKRKAMLERLQAKLDGHKLDGKDKAE